MWDSHPYLFAGLLGLLPLAVGWALFPRIMPSSCLAGLFWLPMAPAAVQHDAYWRPRRLGGLSWGVEDLLYLFTVSALAWLLSAAWVERRHQIILPLRINWRRYAAFCLVGASLNTLLSTLGLHVMTALILVNLALATWLLLKHPAYRPLAWAGLVLLPLFIVLAQKVYFWIWPEYVTAWNRDIFWGERFWGIPLGEVVFHASFVAATPLGVAYCRECALKKLTAISP